MRRDYKAARLTFYSEDGSAETDTFDIFVTVHPGGFARAELDKDGETIGLTPEHYTVVGAVRDAVNQIDKTHLSRPEEVDIADYYPALAQ